LRQGYLDVDEMLDVMTPEQMDGWYAAYLLDPWDDGWRQAGTIASKVNNGCLLVAQSNGADIKQKDFSEPDDFIPKVVFGARTKKRRRRRDETLSARQTELALRRQFGG